MRDSLQLKDTHRLKVKGWRKIIHANGNQNKARIAIFISDKTDCKPKTLKKKKDKVIHYIMIKELIQQHFDVLLLSRVCLMGDDEENNMRVPSSIFY